MKYHRVLMQGDETLALQLLKLGIAIDHSGSDEHEPGIVAEISEAEIQVLKENNIRYKILINDVSRFYAKRNLAQRSSSAPAGTCNYINVNKPTYFHLGSMGGFFTLTEMQQILDSMALLYPNLITVKQALSPQSIEGRDIWYVKISDNPNVDEPEPEMLYTSLHHAREPQSLSQLIFYMWWLLENYASNPEVQATINNSELYFIPCVNPDGYVYNETTNPGGGGMWRKNRRNNGGGTFGVDLNRNYGYNWGFDNIGSSPTSSSDTYRGTAAFSEPEIQAVRNFCNNHQFLTALNAHTYGNLLIYPWGYLPSIYTPDSSTFVNWAVLLTRHSRFLYGTGDQTVNYTTNGDSDDWMYGEQGTKPKILSMTPEAGAAGDGFWPASSRIIDICKTTFYQNYYLARVIGTYAIAQDEQDHFLSNTGYLKYNLQRLGLSPGSFTVSIVPVGTEISSVGADKIYPSLNLSQRIFDSISYNLAGGLNPGQAVKYLIGVNNGYTTHYDTISKIYGTPVTLFSDNGSSTSTNYTTSGTWGLSTTQYKSPPSSITDSPSGNYGSNVNKSITTNVQVNLVGAIYGHLQYYTRFEIEKDYDKAQILVSTNNGASWSNICAPHETPPASFGGTNPLYDGKQDGWVKEEVNLSSYLGQNIRLRFTLTSDFGTAKDGFYFDDLMVRVLNALPAGVRNSVVLSDQIVLSPNPFNGKMNLHNESGKEIGLEIYNALGAKVYETRSASQNLQIELQDQAVGIYFVKLRTDEGESIKKVIKE
jgi:hypothetical protein